MRTAWLTKLGVPASVHTIQENQRKRMRMPVSGPGSPRKVGLGDPPANVRSVGVGCRACAAVLGVENIFIHWN